VTGLVLWVLAVIVTAITGNVILLPTVILLGSFTVPVTGVFYVFEHEPHEIVTADRIIMAFLVGGVLGTLAASLVESWLLPAAGVFQYILVGLIEELVKGLALIAIAWRLHRYVTRDGFVLGTAVGLGFAAFESSGYALVSLFTPQGLSLSNIVMTEALRGLLAPVGHGLWTAILGAAIFSVASRRGHIRITGLVIGAYLLVSVLHGLWDSMQAIALVLTLFFTATAHQIALLQQGTMPPETNQQAWTYLELYWGGLAIVTLIGLAVLWLIRRVGSRTT
jgi:RsiW-degrading membrane proteinase PrsW (M82 family)